MVSLLTDHSKLHASACLGTDVQKAVKTRRMTEVLNEILHSNTCFMSKDNFGMTPITQKIQHTEQKSEKHYRGI